MSRMDIISASLWIQIFLKGMRLFYCIAFLFPISYLIMTDTVKSTCCNIYFLSQAPPLRILSPFLHKTFETCEHKTHRI